MKILNDVLHIIIGFILAIIGMIAAACAAFTMWAVEDPEEVYDATIMARKLVRNKG